ncbi:MAG: NAD(P)/FAD-dependent oxidoreductase [Christensenellaceae bacterium]|jgi:2,4-dienoyl-CoA reductase-like NADH-dependent reductase (Old Yellow Enzyme family)/thioredoxin reductase|nr:NAD(P)/FAD-dependent oxidoreductase [Christensenellaceae bacterium]
METKSLFSPIYIGGCEIKNRIAMAPMHLGMGVFDGTSSEKLVDYYVERAKGGTGLIMTEITRVNDRTGASSFSQLSVSHDYNINSLREFAKRIHNYDAKLFVQLHHPGRQNIGLMVNILPLCIKLSKSIDNFSKLFFKLAPVVGKKLVQKKWTFSTVGPSNIDPSYFSEAKVRELKYAEIKRLITQFIDSAERVQKAGCDGIVLHAAHGYLIQQFLSPYTNKRTDEYGGSLENRMRFLTDIISGIRIRCRDFPIIVRLTVDECYDKIGEHGKGYGLDEGIEMAVRLESQGIDALDVSCASYDTFNYWLEPASFELGWRAYMAKAVKERVSIPVIAANLVRSATQAEAQLREGVQDIISLGRPHIADPAWAKKIQSLREHDVKRCICCLYCFESMQNNAYLGKSGRCAVNPFLGREKHKLIVNGGGRKVLVIGAGPGGLMAAEILTRRGFNVIVYEKRNHVGGQVAIAAHFQEKSKIGWCIEDLKYASEKKGAKILLNTTATVDDVDQHRPYAVIIATGGEPIIPAIEGITKPSVCTANDIFEGKTVLSNKNVSVIGSGMTGLEASLMLAQMGNNVTVIEMSDTIAPGAWMQHRDDILPKLRNLNVEFKTNERLIEIDDSGIIIQNTKSHSLVQTHIDADNAVLAIGVRPESSLFQQLRSRNANVFLIGDAARTGRIANATEDAFRVAFSLGLDQFSQVELPD